ncbi:DUF4179 domain-containing protein [Clostridium perfringens]
MNKKDLDKINLPNNLDDIIDEAISMAHEDKKKNKIKGKGYKKVFKNIAAGLAIITGIGVGTTTLAYGVTGIGNAFEKIQSFIGFNGDYSKYSRAVGKSISNNGLKVTMSEILCDGNELYVTYILESKEPFKYLGKEQIERIKDINSKDYTNKCKEERMMCKSQILDEGTIAKVSFTDEELHDNHVSGLEGRYLNDHTFIGVESYDLTNLKEEVPDEFEFSVDYRKFIGIGDKPEYSEIDGDWSFKVPVKVDKSLVKKMKVNDINKDGIGIKEIISTPIKLKLVTTGYDTEKNDYWVRVYDEKGNILRTDSGDVVFKEGEYLTDIAKEGEDIKKIKVEIYKPFVDENGKDYFHDPRETILYSKEINLE